MIRVTREAAGPRLSSGLSVKSTFGALMAIIVKTLARLFFTSLPYTELLKQIVLLGLAVLLVAILLATYGLDLSAGFF